jgi:histidinol-phosphate aminotransferase
MNYETERVARMHGYTFGEQPARTDVIKLNTNENPYPPSPAVAAALRNFDTRILRRYPPATADRFRGLVAERFGLTPSHVIVTNGGDELLRLAFTTFLDSGDACGTTDPSYSLYPVLADIQGCRCVTIALTDHWSLSAGFAQELNAAGVRLACLVNPHAPTGALTDVDALARIAREFAGVLLIDEAYVDFVDPALCHDTIDLVRTFDYVLLLRTLSKGYSLAGLRLGFGIGAPSLIEPMLTKTRDSYNIDAIAQTLACAAFADLPYAERTWANVRAERQRLADALRERGFGVPASQTNFVLASVPADCGLAAAALHAALKDHGILVRYFDLPRLGDKLRITVGDAAQNDRLLTALDAIMQPTP